VKAWIVKLSFC